MNGTAKGELKRPGIGFNLRRIFFLLLVSIIPGICLLSVGAAYISPGKIWILAVFGLMYHYIYPLNMAFLATCLLAKRRYFVFPFIPFILGLPASQGVFQLGLFNEEKKAVDSLSVKVMTFNSRLFDLYNWSHNLETRAEIFEFFKKEEPDILCLQEFYTSDKKPMRNLETLLGFLKARHYHVEYPVTLRGTDHWGIATFSAYPVVNRGVLFFGKNNGNLCIYTDVTIGKDTLRIFNTHLESIRFRKEDYHFIENIENTDENEALSGSRNILKRLRKAYLKRALEVHQMDSLLRASPYKNIICGDFNDPPASHTYSVLSENMKDAFRESGSGFGETYRGPFPAYRIDYILHAKSIRSYNYKRYNQRLSDHYAISCEISLPKN